MSDIIKPLMLDETGKAIVEALTQREMTQTRIAEINTAADAAKSEIETKTDEQVARIPEVTTLAEDVNGLKDDYVESLKNVSKGENVWRVYEAYDLELGKITQSGAVVNDGITCHTKTKLYAYNSADETNYSLLFDSSMYKVNLFGYDNKTDDVSVYETGYVQTSPLSIYLQNKPYVTANIRRVDGGAITETDLLDIAKAVRLNYAVANSLAKREYVTEAINTLKTMIKPQLNSVVHTIRISESDNLRNVLDSISDASESNRYVVEMLEGTYDIRSYYRDEEWGVEESSFVGLRVPDYTMLIGIGNKENVIIKAEDTSQREYVSALNLGNTCGLKNLTVKAKNLRYTVHDDFAQTGQEHYERLIENCDFYGETLKKVYVYGCGIKEGADYRIRNCSFITDVTSNFSFLIHNNTNWDRCSNVLIENCRFMPYDTAYGIVLSSLGTNTKLTYVVLKGNKMKRLRLNENNASIFGSGITFKVAGYANSIADDVQIMNSDGVDYSDYVNLI